VYNNNLIYRFLQLLFTDAFPTPAHLHTVFHAHALASVRVTYYAARFCVLFASLVCRRSSRAIFPHTNPRRVFSLYLSAGIHNSICSLCGPERVHACGVCIIEAVSVRFYRLHTQRCHCCRSNSTHTPASDLVKRKSVLDDMLMERLLVLGFCIDKSD
jgi:hypothetical protein